MAETDNNNIVTNEEDLLTQREREWNEVEDLILIYQKQFISDDEETLIASKEAADELLERFSPLFKKYLMLLKTGNIDYYDPEMKMFVLSFIDVPALQKALRRTKIRKNFKAEIDKKFKFIVETYGNNSEEEISRDLRLLFLTIAKRYKQMGRSFCGYLYNTYRHEVSRHIKKYTRDPINIPYRILEFEECINGGIDEAYEMTYEDNYYENSIGIPDIGWITGNDCSEIFSMLNPMERKILVKYYLEEWNDRQISEAFGIHINTVNQKRRLAIQKIAKHLTIKPEDIKRNRRSGKNAILPII